MFLAGAIVEVWSLFRFDRILLRRGYCSSAEVLTGTLHVERI